MYLLIDDQTNEVTMTESFLELKQYILNFLFENKADLILDERLQKIYDEIVSDMFVAEDDEAVRRCLNAVNVYFNLRMWVK
ncbi:hypothetical protein [Salinicoccus kekensis]|uniref:Uncharacterized protein n=1 Tax=Salinicoccus kekensis TaxID=714307 RepID=A0A285UTC9_9STAP|nr:hypothetical protein [Salinicoccus kekensis]SOC45082.1 hypothetical protein SAMN05878391_2591 [Salinicoccus kekensis]